MSRYPAPILSMDVSIKGDALVVGMANGMLFSRFHSKERKKGKDIQKNSVLFLLQLKCHISILR